MPLCPEFSPRSRVVNIVASFIFQWIPFYRPLSHNARQTLLSLLDHFSCLTAKFVGRILTRRALPREVPSGKYIRKRSNFAYSQSIDPFRTDLIRTRTMILFLISTSPGFQAMTFSHGLALKQVARLRSISGQPLRDTGH